MRVAEGSLHNTLSLDVEMKSTLHLSYSCLHSVHDEIVFPIANQYLETSHKAPSLNIQHMFPDR